MTGIKWQLLPLQHHEIMGSEPRGEIRPIRAPFPYLLSWTAPENPDNLLVYLPVENEPNYRPIHKNKAEMHLVEWLIFAFTQPRFLPPILAHPELRIANRTRI